MKKFYKFLLFFAFALFSTGAMAQYCNPTYSTGCTYGDGLTLFQLGTINQPITCSSWYHDYTASSTNMTIGNAYTITVQGGYAGTYVNVYIDYNHNNTFDAGELIGQVNCAASATNYTIPFTVPGTALTGNTRLRALTEWYAYPSGPCTAQTYGNCEDFTVNLASAGPCLPTFSTGCSYGDGLTLFNLNTINQAVACNGSPNTWYHDWTGTSTTLMLNTNYTLTVQVGFPSQYVCVWIDYNNDNTFAATERVVTDLYCTSSATNFTATINIPNGTPTGNHRMRFVCNYASSSQNPCGAYTYGNCGDFTANLILFAGGPPVVVTTVATSIAGTIATLNGTVNANNSATTTSFDYGLTTAYGTNVTGVPLTVNGTTVTGVSAGIVGLIPNTLYHFRINGVNTYGTSNGGDLTFTTATVAPVITTLAATGVTNAVATLNGSCVANNSSTTVSFEYGLTTTYGSTAAGIPSPIAGMASTNFSANIGGLTSNQTYHFRAKGVNAGGTSYGTDQTFFTVCLTAGAAGPITGPGQVCNGGSGYVYTVAAITNATGYTWSVPFGATITAGANTNTITVSFPNPSFSGNVSVYGVGCAGNGTPSYMPLYVNAAATPTLTGPTAACVNVAGNLYTTQAGMTGYAWTITGGTATAGGTATSNTATVTWTSAGARTISVNYNNANGCAGITPATVNVTVNALPTPIITGDANPCSGFTTVYSTQAGMTGYNWTLSPGGTIQSGAGTNAITVLWSGTGAQSVNVVYANANGCANTVPTAYNVTVKGGPSPTITGPGAVCINSGYQTYTTQASMTGYNWTISAGGTINFGGTTNTVTVTWNTAGSQSLSVNYSNAAGCTSATPGTIPVTIVPLPGAAGSITGPSNICDGETGKTYSVATIPYAHSYIWTLPAGANIVSGLYSNTITVDYPAGALSGNITVYANSTCGNGATSPPLAVTVTAVPTPVITVAGLTLSSDAPTGNQWYLDGSPISGATGQTYVATLPGVYSDIVTINGCVSGESNHITITVGVNSPSGSGISIYPVPNDGQFKVSITSSSSESFTLSVLNNLGVTIYQQKDIQVKGTVEKIVDLRPISSGIYTVILRNSENQVVRKILVNK
ncbi:MAG: GEVED domain-containing protein [Bacteroidetes bacterium]|nr:GEVED domain-containing protein [Bacteroidota bacterium]